MNDKKYMSAALALAREAAASGETPVGAVIVRDGVIVGQGKNLREQTGNALRHAEINAVENACETLGGWRLSGCTLYVTLEPCPMCAGAVINSRIDRVVFGAYDKKAGSAGSVVNLFELDYNHKPEVTGGVMADECETVLKEFFAELRRKKKMFKTQMTEVKTKDQIERTAALADEIWHEWFPRILSAEQIDYMVEKFQSAAAMTRQISEENYRYFIIRKGESCIGYTAIKPDGDSLFLSKIYIKKEHRGNGYGKEVFEFLKNICREEGFTSIWLTVNKYNESSIAVYKKIGFELFGEGVADIGGGFVMDDYYFRLKV
ncbi:MAG: GNAT family N-acetyltransferase [Muribaculaceae bacterium]|nr:GNAT family N-acetyltransferase [Muribaculaceae bacterium]